MKLNFSYDKTFVTEFNKIREKYNKELLNLEGISDENLDIVSFAKNFNNSINNADGSIDSNANQGSYKTMVSFNKESVKPLTKLNSYYLIWKELYKIYDLKSANKALEDVVSGKIYIHDSTNMSLPYCFNYTCYDIVLNGLPDWSGMSKVKNPTTIKSYLNQVKNFLISAGNYQLGATGIADILIFLSWYVQRIYEYESDENGLFNRNNFKDDNHMKKVVYDYVKSELRSFIYDLNFNYRGEQSLFTNVSLYDDHFLDNLLPDINMVEKPFKISKDIVKDIQELYMTIFNEELDKTILTYPVTTASFTRCDLKKIDITLKFNTNDIDSFGYKNRNYMKMFNELGGDKKIEDSDENDYRYIHLENINQFSKIKVLEKGKMVEIEKSTEDLKIGDKILSAYEVTYKDEEIIEKNHIRDKEFMKTISKYNVKYQWINNFFGESSVLSSCCRLKSDMNDLEKESFGSVGGSGSAKIGSIGVVTINMPQVVYRYKNNEIDDINKELRELTDLTIKINYAKRKLIKKRIDQGLLPIYTDGFMLLQRQFSTTGIVGAYEFVKEMGYDITKEDGINFLKNAINIIDYEQNLHHKNYDMYKDVPFNIEQVPAENASVKLAKKDKVNGYSNDYSLYSNQFIPLYADANILDRIKLSGEFDSLFSGGSILHLNFDSPVDSIDDNLKIMEYVAKSGCGYYAINHNLGNCSDCNSTFVYKHHSDSCPNCGSKNVKLYERVVGFLVPVDSYSSEKYENDYLKRQHYKSNVI